MFIFTAKFSRKKAVIILLALGVVLCCAVVLVGIVRRGGAQPRETSSLDDNGGRIAYLESLGWSVSPQPIETIDLILPETLGESYADYNDLQKEQGLDLSSACGKHVKRYTYSVTNYPGGRGEVQADIYVCGGEVVAGDILSSGENGFIAGLDFPE